MFRSLAAKALVPVAFTITGFVGMCCVLLYSHMKQDLIEQSVIHATDVANVLMKSTRYAMLREDRETLRNVVANVGEEKLVEHVRIFNKKGLVVFSSDPSEVGNYVDKDAEGCSNCHSGDRPPAKSLGPMEQARRFVTDSGEPVLAITAPIYNEPECFNAACHYHPPDQTVLGTLDIGLSEAPLLHTLGVTRRRLILFSVMVLILSVGGVTALLQWNVVRPLRELNEYAERLEAGEDAPPPPGLPRELREVAQRMRAIMAARGSRGGESSG